MMTFSVVRRIGEGSYLNDDLFIIERVRKERALNMGRPRGKRERSRIKPFLKHGKFNAS